MAGFVLTTATAAKCPHGAKITFTPSQFSVLIDSAPVVLEGDLPIFAPCPFMVGPVASPCVMIEWSKVTTKVKVKGQKLLLSTSLGMCKNASSAPQGPVLVTSCQSKVQAT